MYKSSKQLQISVDKTSINIHNSFNWLSCSSYISKYNEEQYDQLNHFMSDFIAIGFIVFLKLIITIAIKWLSFTKVLF